jgi:hypothetical protein
VTNLFENLVGNNGLIDKCLSDVVMSAKNLEEEMADVTGDSGTDSSDILSGLGDSLPPLEAEDNDGNHPAGKLYSSLVRTSLLISNSS